MLLNKTQKIIFIFPQSDFGAHNTTHRSLNSLNNFPKKRKSWGERERKTAEEGGGKMNGRGKDEWERKIGRQGGRVKKFSGKFHENRKNKSSSKTNYVSLCTPCGATEFIQTK